MPTYPQIWFPSGEAAADDAKSGRGTFTRRHLSVLYAPPGDSEQPAATISHQPLDTAGLVVPALKVEAGIYSHGDAVLIEKFDQTGAFLTGEYQGSDLFSMEGDGDIWNIGTMYAHKANVGGIVAAVDGTTALDMTQGNVFTCTPAENTSWSTSAPTNGIGGELASFVVDNSGGFTVAWAVGFTDVDAIGAGDTGISVRTLQFDGTTWYQVAATLDGDAINAGAGDVDGSGTADFIPKWLDADTLTDSIIREIAGEIGIGVAPNEVFTVEGVLSLKEGAAPGATADYGKIYVKAADSGLFFMEDDGTEHDLLAGGAAGVFREIATGNIFGPSTAGNDATTGDHNFAAIAGALDSLTSGNENIAIGKDALTAHTGGTFAGYHIALGTSALASITGDALEAGNVAMGYYAGNLLNDGEYNTFLGYYAARRALSGSYNIAIGPNALDSLNGTGYDAFANIGIGLNAGYDLTTATGCVFIGEDAAQKVTIGDDNIAIGTGALSWETTGEGNIAIGDTALNFCRVASFNVGVGDSALSTDALLSGDHNVGIGGFCGYKLEGDSDNNILIGWNSGPNTGAVYDDRMWIDTAQTDTPTLGGDFANGRIGILVDPSALANILEVQQTSATDPIADNWTTYPSDRKHKDILAESGGLIESFKKIKTYRYKRKPLVSEAEVQHEIRKRMKEELKGERHPKLFEAEGFFNETALLNNLETSKASLPKFTSERFGVSVDDPEIPAEILVKNEAGEVTGVDLLGYVGYLHAVVRELAMAA